MPRLTPEQETAFWRRRAEGAGHLVLAKEFGITRTNARERLVRRESPAGRETINRRKRARAKRRPATPRKRIIDSYGDIVNKLLAHGKRDRQFEKCLCALTPNLRYYIELADERDRRLAALQRK